MWRNFDSHSNISNFHDCVHFVATVLPSASHNATRAQHQLARERFCHVVHVGYVQDCWNQPNF